ncbi:hypothetical protein VTN00DRAFT_60 [Thermoascus crustaceus]|uniref:uncharacterized protein n=1 Tax=Thermoascus crustaceus TaxID=5088 RepID=UPI0037441E6C
MIGCLPGRPGKEERDVVPHASPSRNSPIDRDRLVLRSSDDNVTAIRPKHGPSELWGSGNITPSLVVLCAWLFAAPKHIAKYTQLYQTRLPHAEILLIRPVPAVVAIRRFLDSLPSPPLVTPDFSESDKKNKKEERHYNYNLLIHAFSNAGSHAAVQLAEAFLNFQNENRPLPITGSLVLKALGAALIYLVIGVVAVLDAFSITENVISKTRRELNNITNAFLQPWIPRVYLYSKADVMVPWRDVLAHTDLAKQKLQLLLASQSQTASPQKSKSFDLDDLIRTVQFNGGSHAGHITVAEERNWKEMEWRCLSW